MNSCPVCSSKETFEYMNGIYDSDSTSVMECKKCGFQFLAPIMTLEEESEYYADYYHSQKPRQYKKFSLKDIQQNVLAHYNQYKEQYGSLIKNSRNLLEIGSGTGAFLQFVKDNNPDCKIVSTERSKANIDFLTDMGQNQFQSIRFYTDSSEIPQVERFDTIIAFAVFEHLRDQHQFLRDMAVYLRDKNSCIVINMPNKKDPLIDFYKSEPYKKFHYMKQHYFTHSETSMEIMAKKCDLKVDRFEYLQVYSLDNHVSWMINGKPMDFSGFTNRFSANTIKSYNEDLIRSRTTDMMVAILKKNGG